MTHRTRPARTPLALGLAAFALLSVCALAPRPGAVAAVLYDSVKKEWLLYALRSGRHDEAALVRLVERRGVTFRPTAEDEKELRAAGATDRLLKAVRKNHRPPPSEDGLGFAGGVGAGPGRGAAVGYGEGGPANSGSEDYTRPFRLTEVTRKARITFRLEPGYTDEARRNRVEGVVRLRAVLNLSGDVTDIHVVKGLPDGLTEQAIAVARQIQFTPAEKDGRKVSQYIVLEYSFIIALNEKDVDERAIILEKPEAEYTEAARRNNVRGKVVLKVTLTASGRVAVHTVEAGLPHGLTEQAAAAAWNIVFEPARRGGRAVSQHATVEYIFAP